MQIDAATVENSMEVSQSTKNRVTYDPAILLLGIYIYIYEKGKNINSKRYMYPKVHSSIILFI